MAEPVPESWPKDGSWWKVHWYGAARYNPGTPSDPSIDLILQKLPSGNPAEFKIIKIGIGALCRYPIDTVWKNGKYLFDYKHAVTETFQLDFGSTIEKAHAYSKNESGEYLIPRYQYRIPFQGGFSPLWVVPTEERNRVCLIPSTEVCRSYFLRSTTLTNKLLKGGLDAAWNSIFEDPENATQDANRRVVVKRGLGRNDIDVAIMLAASKKARNAFRSMLHNLYTDKINGKPQFLSTLAPLEGRHEIKVRGRWLGSGTHANDRFLATQLLSLPSPQMDFPVEECEILGMETSATAAGDSANSRVIPIRRNQKERQNRITTSSEPNKNKGLTIAKAHVARLEYSIDLVVAESEDATELINQSNQGENDPQVFSTGAGGYSGDVDPIRFTQSPEKEKPKKTESRKPVSFKDLVSALDILTEKHGFFCTPIIIGHKSPHTSTHWPASELPTELNHSIQNWAQIRGRPRALMAAKISKGKQSIYCFDIERKPGRDNITRESFTLFLKWEQSGAPLSSITLSEVANVCVHHKGVWPKKSDDGCSAKLKHLSPVSEHMAAGILKKFNSMQSTTIEQSQIGKLG